MPARPMRKCSCGDEHPCSTLAKERADSKKATETPAAKKPDEGKTTKASSDNTHDHSKKASGDLEKRAKSFLRDLIG